MSRKNSKQIERPFIALDLEMNLDPVKGTLPIIQIGAVAGNPLTGQIYDELSIYVNPDEQLLDSIKLLTAITDEDVATAPKLVQAVQALNAWCEKYNAVDEAIVWGAGDTDILYEQTKSKYPENNIYLRRKVFTDTRALYKAYAIKHSLKRKKNLVDACAICGVQFQGRPHDALNDARATFMLASYLINQLKG